MASSGNQKKPGEKQGTSRPDIPVESSESCFLDAEPSTSFKHSTLNISSPRNNTPSRGKKKLSLRKLSIESSNLPLNDDCTELNEEKEKSIAENEKSVNKSSNRANEDEPDVSIITTMTEEQMNEHVTQCLQLSTENKINTKNAFALKLIDCMTIITKNEDKSNFAAMACQLDAGAKIYSSRVDAVHQQVMKLVETCMYAEKKDNDKDGDDDNGEGTGNVEKKKKPKKKVITTNDQISRLPKENDPRDKFFKIEALPGEILKRAIYNPTDLSLTLEKNIPFWPDLQSNKRLVIGGEQEIPYIDTKDRSQRTKLDLENTIDKSCLPKLSICKRRQSEDEMDQDYEGPLDIYDSDSNDENNLEINQKEEKDIELISVAKLRMASEGNVPTRTEVMKTLFHTPGESDYHYLKMDSHRFWAGPAHWKRPQGNLVENKKKMIRKKKEPAEVLYTQLQAENESEAKGVSKKSTTLSKRTTGKWSVKKTTLPQDIHFDLETFHKVFHMNVVAEVFYFHNFPTEENENPNNDEPNDNNEDAEDSGEMLVDNDNGSPDRSSSPYEFRGFPSPSDAGSSSPFDPERGFRGFPSPSQEGNGGSSPFDPENGFRGFGSQEDISLPVPAQSEENGGGSAQPQEVYDGDNLVPMVRTVRVEPLRFVAKPSRVDMQHLKQVMLGIIRRAIEDRENELRSNNEESPRGSVMFKEVLQELYNSEALHRRTRQDLTMQMAFLAVLSLANENNFSMKSDDTGDFCISYA